MSEEAKKVVADILAGGEVDGVLCLQELEGSVGPHYYRSGEGLEGLVLKPKYALPLVLRWFHQHSPETKVGAVLRGCEERALVELSKRRQVDLDKVQVIGLACTEEEAKECGCASGRPSQVMIGTPVEGLPGHRELRDLPEVEDHQRLEFWRAQYAKCIKCYGCRDVCPVCACEECMMAEHEWVQGGSLPPTFATFHLIKAYHMADRCVECRECEAACPVSIPLAELYGRLLRDVDRRFGYVTGANEGERPPLLTALMDAPILEGEEGGD
jgi:ferredoxin